MHSSVPEEYKVGPGAYFALAFAAVPTSIGACIAVMFIMKFDKGIISGEHLAILAPAIYLMGSQVQYPGRVLGVIGSRARLIPLMVVISVVNAFLAMLLMRIIL